MQQLWEAYVANSILLVGPTICVSLSHPQSQIISWASVCVVHGCWTDLKTTKNKNRRKTHTTSQVTTQACLSKWAYEMAKICCCWFNGTPLQLRRNHGVEYINRSNRKSFAIFNRGKREQTETPQVLKTVVSGITELLRLFSPSPQTRCYAMQTTNPIYSSSLIINISIS